MAKIKDIDLENLEGNGGHSVSLEGMYKEYFLDYASYVILERAVPHINDGLKPVQRRILHSMKKMDDGRFHKVANIIGQTMQYHPHGDAAIGAALVNLGQKDLLVETQGNWGDYRTGDAAAAPRYIEARLTKFALEVVFNPQTTDWQISYDGRNKEPITLPVKFPLVLAQGVEGIAVGLSTKILPHNFNELIKASIKTLEEKRVKIYPDFPTGGLVDVSDYNSGKRGGKIRVRAKIEQRDKSTLAITELPYGVTTDSLIDSILKANDKGKIQIKKVIDNTAADVEIMLELPSGVSPDVSLDALYAFTNCEVSISPTAVVIIDNKPVFSSVEDLLKLSTESTKNLLRQELEIKKHELLEKWHGVSLEKIFIEKEYGDLTIEELQELNAQYTQLVGDLNALDQQQIDAYNTNLLAELNQIQQDYYAAVNNINQQIKYEGRTDILTYNTQDAFDKYKLDYTDYGSARPQSQQQQGVNFNLLKEYYGISDSDMEQLKNQAIEHNINSLNNEDIIGIGEAYGTKNQGTLAGQATPQDTQPDPTPTAQDPAPPAEQSEAPAAPAPAAPAPSS